MARAKARQSKNEKRSTINFLWDGDNIAMELDASRNVKNICHRDFN